MLKCLVFDLDDTLYDEIEYCKSGFQAVSAMLQTLKKDLDSEAVYSSLWHAFTKGDKRRVFNTVLDEYGVSYDQEFIKKLVNVYREHVPSIHLPQESSRVLEDLSNHFTLALLTDGFLPAQRLKVEALGIEHYFKIIIYTEQLGRECWKPSPVGFKKIMVDLAVSGRECVYIGDNVQKDFIAPNELGFTSIQIIRQQGVHTAQPPSEKAKADYVIRSLTELPNLISTIEKE